MTKEKKTKVKKEHTLLKDFKAFISRGNVVDLAVGVVIGGAFGAIVTAVVNVLLSVCMWPVPGGLSGLITVLPAVSAGQHAPTGYADVYTVSDFLAEDFTSTEAGMYVQHGGNYYYKGCAIIDWGTIINTVISFLIIALVLFAIVRVIATLKKKDEQMKAAALERYYEKHPEERPAPVVPGKPAPTEAELLTEIRDLLANKK